LGTDARDSGIDLTGQVALVTGGGGDLGRAFALALAGAGARGPWPVVRQSRWQSLMRLSTKGSTLATSRRAARAADAAC
jgi:NAD(P)-dependent dehydrogenase (short-subunit alcohol dehydrogenase family)